MLLSFRILKAASPPFGAMVKEQAELEGQYRFVHSRLISNSEEVAFYGGEKVRVGDRMLTELVELPFENSSAESPTLLHRSNAPPFGAPTRRSLGI